MNKQIEERINKTTEQLYKDSAQVRKCEKGKGGIADRKNRGHNRL